MFEVVGFDDSYTVLQECSTSHEAIQWMNRYVSKEDAGGWDVIEVYDQRGECGDFLATWRRD